VLFALSSVPKGIPVRWLTALEPLILKRYHPKGVISIAFVSQHEIHRLNLLYRGKNAPTDVLSFQLSIPDAADNATPSDTEGIHGEILFCAKILEKYAHEKGRTVAAEFQAMVIHATLHLMGYDHEAPRPRQSMEAQERAIARELKKNLGKAAKFQYTKGTRRKVKRLDSPR
jgi:probable rRNA maturation factor